MALPAGWRLLPPITAEAWAGHCWAAGFRGDGLVTAVAVAMAESSLIPNNRNVNTDSRRTIDRGILQFNSFWHPEVSDAEADDPAAAAVHGYRVTSAGSKWSEWSTWKGGYHRKHLTVAKAAADAVAARGGNPGGGAAGAVDTSGLGLRLNLPIGPQPVGPIVPPVPPFVSRVTRDVGVAAGPAANTSLTSRVKPATDLGELVSSYGATLAEHGLAGTVVGTPSIKLSTSAVGELRFDIVTRASIDQVIAKFQIRGDVTWRDLPMVVSSHEVGDLDGVPFISITCRAGGPQRMRRKMLGQPSRTWHRASPTEVLQELAAGAGLRFVAKGSASRQMIVRAGDERSTVERENVESDWDLAQRFANEEGYWAFEAAGTFYFAPPTWLVLRQPVFTAIYDVPDQGPAPVRVWEIPALYKSMDVDGESDGQVPASIDVVIPRNVGELVRPGMAMHFAGMAGWDTLRDGRMEKLPYLITDVDWGVDAGETPVRVKAVTPIDPVPSLDAAADTLAPDPAVAPPMSSAAGSSGGERTRFQWPTKGQITGQFGEARKDHRHEGIDIANVRGTLVVAAAGGTVTRADLSSSYGNVVYMTHADGWETRYAHLSAFACKKGDSVGPGAPVGFMGNTGRSSGPHLHFETRRKNDRGATSAVDPRSVLPPGP